MVTHDANVARSAFRLLMFRDGNIERDIPQDEFAANRSVQLGSGQFPKRPCQLQTIQRFSRRGIANAVEKTFHSGNPKQASPQSLTLLSIVIGVSAMVATYLASDSAELAQMAMVRAVTGNASLEIEAVGGASFDGKPLEPSQSCRVLKLLRPFCGVTAI